ncbi:hypothetical protein MMC29_008430 [Sticta canariensis]|nr:hypothetical protein [Sticta canariensis]
MDVAPFRLTFGMELEFIVRYKPENYQDGLLTAEEQLWTSESSPTLHQKYGILVRVHMIQILIDNGFPTNRFRETDFSKWTVDTDGSVTPSRVRGNWYPIELKTPILVPSVAVFESVERAVQLLRSHFHLHTNKRCGLHVHVGNENRGFDLPTLKTFGSLITVFESQLNSLHSPDRLANQYASLTSVAFPNVSVRDKLSIVDKLETIDDLILQFHLTDELVFDKYMAFNFFNLQECLPNPLRTIEFRQHQGTLDPRLIRSWAMVACHLVRLSKTEGAAIRTLIERHIEDTTYTVLDLFRDLQLPNLAGFYATRLGSGAVDDDENLDEDMEDNGPPPYF